MSSNTRSAAPVARTRRPKGRLERRSAGDIGALVEKIVGVLEAAPSGLRSEQIRDRLVLYLDSNDEILVAALSGEAAWNRFPGRSRP